MKSQNSAPPAVDENEICLAAGYSRADDSLSSHRWAKTGAQDRALGRHSGVAVTILLAFGASFYWVNHPEKGLID